MIDLTKLPADEAERLAYAEGYTGTAALFARIADLEHAAQTLLRRTREQKILSHLTCQKSSLSQIFSCC